MAGFGLAGCKVDCGGKVWRFVPLPFRHGFGGGLGVGGMITSYVFLYQIMFSSLQSSSRSTESRLREAYQTYIVYWGP